MEIRFGIYRKRRLKNQ
jgi:hypothetical protein